MYGSMKHINPLLGLREKNKGKKIRRKKIRRKQFFLILLGLVENKSKENEQKIIFFCLVEQKSEWKEN